MIIEKEKVIIQNPGNFILGGITHRESTILQLAGLPKGKKKYT